MPVLRPLLLLLIGAATILHGQRSPAVTGSCRIDRVTSLPGSREFASDFLEAIATDPSGREAGTVWGLTADLSPRIPAWKRAIYLVRSSDGGETWAEVARLGARYFDAAISEGLRNGLAVAPDGRDFVVTTQLGAFQVIPGTKETPMIVRAIPGPRVPSGPPRIPIPKYPGEPVRAGVARITADGSRLIVGYGYFDLDPELWTYRRGADGSWVREGALPELPTDLDIFSMQFDDPARPQSLYVGTGDQAFRFDLGTGEWTEIAGVGPDSAIHSMSTVGGLHLAACWGVYNPVGRNEVTRVKHASFLLHPGKDEAGPNIRAYGIEVDPLRPNREILTAITGVYKSEDSGETWKRLNDFPEGEYHTAHFNPDGTVIVSGFPGTFVADPFEDACPPRLTTRDR